MCVLRFLLSVFVFLCQREAAETLLLLLISLFVLAVLVCVGGAGVCVCVFASLARPEAADQRES